MTLQERLVIENQILKKDGLSQFQVYYYSQGDFYYLQGDHRTNIGNIYTILGKFPCSYPNGYPRIYVHRPNPLWGYGRIRTINSYGVSHDMHTFSNGPEGKVQICHWRDEKWHSGITLNKVMLKVVLWLEAYEQHLSTGKPIREFVGTIK